MPENAADVLVSVDQDICQGNSQCAFTAPEVFEVLDDLAEVRRGVAVDEHREAIETAVDRCPTGAISIAWKRHSA